MWSTRSRMAKMPPKIFGCSVFTRPSSISGKPVYSATSKTFTPDCSKMASGSARAVDSDPGMLQTDRQIGQSQLIADADQGSTNRNDVRHERGIGVWRSELEGERSDRLPNAHWCNRRNGRRSTGQRIPSGDLKDFVAAAPAEKSDPPASARTRNDAYVIRRQPCIRETSTTRSSVPQMATIGTARGSAARVLVLFQQSEIESQSRQKESQRALIAPKILRYPAEDRVNFPDQFLVAEGVELPTAVQVVGRGRRKHDHPMRSDSACRQARRPSDTQARCQSCARSAPTVFFEPSLSRSAAIRPLSNDAISFRSPSNETWNSSSCAGIRGERT